MLFLYTFGYYATLCLAALASPFSPKLKKGIWGRRGLTRRIKENCKGWNEPLWFHVASSGELEQCLPILDEIKHRAPEEKIFLSYFSPSGKKGIELEIKRRESQGRPLPWDYADYCPFDLSLSVFPFLDALRPKKLICIQREIWPNLISACKQRQIPTYLFSSFFSPEGKRVFPFYRPWIRHFDFIGTVDDETTAFLVLELHADHIQTLGDPRVERVRARRESSKTPAWKPFFEKKPVFLAGSIWPKDFKNLVPTLRELSKSDWRIVLAPHQPSKAFVGALKRWGSENNFSFRQWSRWLKEPDDHSHLIIDSVGSLAELYQIASLCFVGGSFKKRVHNVLEPAAYGIPILTGPLTQNSSEAQQMARQGALFACESAEVLLKRALTLIGNEEIRRETSELSEAFITKQTGISERYSEILLNT